jgi:hypothetical protein
VKGTKTRTGKKEGRESKNQGRDYERCMTEEIPEDLGREENEGEVQMWERGERKQDWMEGKERRCRICYGEKKTMEQMWNGCKEEERSGEKYRMKTEGR